MPLWLAKVLGSLADGLLAVGRGLREIRLAVRARYALLTGETLAAQQARALVSKSQRRIAAAEELMDSGGKTPRPQNLPRCPELSSGTKQYHATVYVDIIDSSGRVTDRIRTTVNFDNQATADDILSAAADQVNKARRTGMPIPGGPPAGNSSQNLIATAENGSVASLCYG